jgi:predicted RNA-binding Zn-ribbon protein involved in translation (DUF1610 family)
MNPVCTDCKVEMKCSHTGVKVAPNENPYWVRSGDEFTCPSCDSSIIVNFGSAFDGTPDITVG